MQIYQKKKKIKGLPAHCAGMNITLEIRKEMNDISSQQHQSYHTTNNVTLPTKLKLCVAA
jgi:hypothetical protein